MFLFCFLLAFHVSAVAADGNASDECVANPTSPSCANYNWPVANASNSIGSLCEMMPWMNGCSVRRLCTSGAVHSAQFCSPYSLVADVCVADPGMSHMHGCGAVNALCHGPNGTAVKQCASDAFQPLVAIPGSMDTRQAVLDMCAHMSMPGCDKCTSATACDEPLLALAAVCLSMEMSQCKPFYTMCDALRLRTADNWTVLCPTADEQPMMRMYFHASLADYVLFYEWVPRTTLQYAFTCVAIVAMAQVSALLKIGRRRAVERLQQHQRRARAHRSAGAGASPSAVAAADDTVPMIAPDESAKVARKAAPTTIPMRLLLAAFAFAIVAIDYALMLIAMTFNVGLVLAVFGGVALSHALFGLELLSLTDAGGDGCCEH
jgi:copper transporter 1